MPGRTECDIASPINDQPLSTKKQDSIAVGMATKSTMVNACSIKVNVNGSTSTARLPIGARPNR